MCTAVLSTQILTKLLFLLFPSTHQCKFKKDDNKPNQDSFSISTNFNNNLNDALFSVFDGHGRYGDKCAQFASTHLPSLLARHVEKKQKRQMKRKSNLQSDDDNNEEGKENNHTRSENDHHNIGINQDMFLDACANAHKQCNLAMHRNEELDDKLSGTTAISCHFNGRKNRITVCNVGDSRAVLGKRVNRNSYCDEGGEEAIYKALPLSRDQTPYRRDERTRIRATGARVLSLDQIEGNEPIIVEEDEDETHDMELGREIDEDGDPPRVWHPRHDYPGTAFTRSLGDHMAEELGVFAEPEMVTRDIEDGDEIIVLASDGVFEFLTNQSVIDICAKHKDPLAACKAVVAASYDLWLQYELRTDDITMICLFIDSNDEHAPGPLAPKVYNFKDNDNTVKSPSGLVIDARDSKPVRSRPSIEKTEKLRQMSSKFIDNGDEVDHVDLSDLHTEKTEQEISCIAQAIKTCVMLKNINDDQRDMIFGVMEPVEAKAGDWIIRQGAVGDRFYIVERGSFEVRIVPEGQTDKKNNGGALVHMYEGSLEKQLHPSFGELALLYSVPRAASIIAKTDGKLWALHKNALRKVLVEQSGRKDLLKIIRTIRGLQDLSIEEMEYVAGTMKLETFAKGHEITTRGSSGSSLYVISKGQCGKYNMIGQSEKLFILFLICHLF